MTQAQIKAMITVLQQQIAILQSCIKPEVQGSNP